MRLRALRESEKALWLEQPMNEAGKESRGIVQEAKVWQPVWTLPEVGQCTGDGPGGE